MVHDPRSMPRLWAVDEAVSRDIPLRLVYAIDPQTLPGTDPHDGARELAAAEVAVRYAFTAVESTDKPVKIEVEILQDRPTRALLEASRWAALLCVGAMGLKHCAQGRIGSTAAALASSARCPVAVVRGHDPLRAEQQWVVAEVDESAAAVCYGERSRALLEGCEVETTLWERLEKAQLDAAQSGRSAPSRLRRRGSAVLRCGC